MKYLSSHVGKCLLGLLVVITTACSTPDNSDPPAELTSIEDAQTVRELWSVDTGSGAQENYFDMPPLIIGDTIYTIDIDGLIHQIDATRGRSDWSYKTGLASMSGLSGNTKSLFATSSEGVVARFDVTPRKLVPVWQQPLNSEIRTRAIVDDRQVFVRTVDGKLSALNVDTGNIQWSVSRRVPALSLTGNSHPLVVGDLVIAGFDNGKLTAFEKESGSTVWETSIGSPSGRTEIERLIDLDGQFLLRDGVIYAATYQGNLVAITANSGQVVWSRKFSSFQSIEADDEALYLTDERSHVWSIDRRTGGAFWKQDVLNARKLTAPRLVGDSLVVADLEGYVHYLSKLDGSLLARIQPESDRYVSQPLTIGTRVILLNNVGVLTAIAQPN
jgi:outer membrane protein assembly factor BamB